MENKTCAKCKESKPKIEFIYGKTRLVYCKSCTKQKQKELYQKRSKTGLCLKCGKRPVENIDVVVCACRNF